MPVISNLKSNRTREKRALVKEETEAQKTLESLCPSNPMEIEQQLISIGKIILNLEKKLSRLEIANERLAEAYEQNEDTAGAEQFQATLDEDSELVDGIIDKMSQLKILKEELERKRKESEGRTDRNLERRLDRMQEQVSLIQSTHRSTDMSSIWSQPTPGPLKPPQLDITTFSGDVLKWQEFWDAFDASIHQASYAPVDKFNYLKSKLKGDALEAISGYQLSNDNYPVVIDVLKKRFGNQQLIIDAHYHSLSRLPPATNQVVKLRHCYDNIERHLRSLEAIGENVNHRHFIALILDKLPQRVRYQLFMQKPEGEEWTVPKLHQSLAKYISAMEMAGSESPETTVTHLNSGPSQRNRPPRQISTTEGLLASNSKSMQPQCIYCTESHWSDECPKYSTLQARKEKLKGSCFNCLRKGHTLKDCTIERACAHCGRKKSHHRSLCQKLFKPPVEKTETTMVASSNQVLMQTATAVVENSQGTSSVPVRLILDSGSQRSYITDKLARGLKLTVDPIEKLSVVTFGSDKPKKIDYRPSKLKLLLKDGSVMLLKVAIVPNITGKVNRIPLKKEDLEFLNKEFTEGKLADTLPCQVESSTIEMLIGNDYYFDLLQPRKMELGGGLSLFHSKLGWILGGRIESTTENKEELSLLVSTMGSAPLDIKPSTHMLTNIDLSLVPTPSLEQFWNLESIGITESPVVSDDDQAIENFNKTIKFTDGRYSVRWPWKESNPLLPDNYYLAEGRLKSTLQRLIRDPHLFEMYAEIIQKQLDRQIIEKVYMDSPNSYLKHYIPHHPVVTPTKATTKVRVVYDASAKTKGTNKSLNECLYRGPIILPDLFGLLLRFRLHPIAIIADIEKAFLNIGPQVQDRDVTRFLWLKDPSNPNLDDNIQIYRFCRIPFGVISSPFLLEATISYHLRQAQTPIADHIQRDIYVDNIVTGSKNLEEAKNIYSESKALFSKAAMNLREWGSNSKEFMNFVTEQDRTSGSTHKVLGVTWNSISDTLMVPGTIIQQNYRKFYKTKGASNHCIHL